MGYLWGVKFRGSSQNLDLKRESGYHTAIMLFQRIKTVVLLSLVLVETGWNGSG
jgi:hypothetical protein